MLKRLVSAARARGVRGVLRVAAGRLERWMGVRARCHRGLASRFLNKSGLEVGGPSEVFGAAGHFPVYPLARTLDNCNFAACTVWEGDIGSRSEFVFDPSRTPGLQLVCEATALDQIASGAYDFVLSSHMLEHSANPLRALREWIRVLRDGGTLALFLPHKDWTFDHRRPVTTLTHMIADFEDGTTEGDLTHLEEILALHDLTRDPGAGDQNVFRERALRNAENRCLHHHVFDEHIAVQLVDHTGLQILAVETLYPIHILLVAARPASGARADNSAFLRRG